MPTSKNPSRVVVGHCPECKGVVIVTNEYGVWDIATCPCGWQDGTTALVNHVRLERGGVLKVGTE